MGTRTWAGAATAVALMVGTVPWGSAAGTAETGVVPCSSGLVALTFDDGPDPAVTPRLVAMLTDLRVPATLFVNGADVDAAPWVTKQAYDAGLTIGNHTYAHERLTTLDAARILRTMRQTRHSIVAAGARPSRLMRPPYGLIDRRVRRTLASLRLQPVMWTVDPRDWEGDRAAVLARRVLGLLRPHRRNVVLQHDGIVNSPSSVAAVPRIVRGARARGYCFAALDRRGRPRPPVPRLTVEHATAVESGALRFVLRLDRPTSRVTAVRVSSRAGSADRRDVATVDERVELAVGARFASVTVRVRNDRLDEPREWFHLTLSEPHGLVLDDDTARGSLVDDDRPPSVRVSDSAVTASGDDSTWARVDVHLDVPSGRPVRVRLGTVDGTAEAAHYVPRTWWRRFTPGSTTRSVRVQVLAHKPVAPEQPGPGADPDGDMGNERTFRVQVLETRHATVSDGSATVTIRPTTSTEP